MKRNILFALTFIGCILIFGACSNKDSLPEISPLALYDTESKSTISIGMTRKEVENILGQPKYGQHDNFDNFDPQDYTVFPDIRIKFDEKDEIVSLALEGSTSARFKTSKGVSIGSTKEELYDKYDFPINKRIDNTKIDEYFFFFEIKAANDKIDLRLMDRNIETHTYSFLDDINTYYMEIDLGYDFSDDVNFIMISRSREFDGEEK